MVLEPVRAWDIAAQHLAAAAHHPTAPIFPLRTSATSWFHSACVSITRLSSSPILARSASMLTSGQCSHSVQRLKLTSSMGLSPS